MTKRQAAGGDAISPGTNRRAAVLVATGRWMGAAALFGSLACAVYGQDGAKPPDLDRDPANLKGERMPAVGDEPLAVDLGAKGVAQMLIKLRTRASLMMIVAHPDDEDGGMLTYESRGRGVRVGMLTLTRGEGGQNVMSGDFNDALGLVRTRELLAADRYLGVDQMFGTEVDFGFSKTKEEAFSQWTHERVLRDAVRAVRLYRPLVVTSVFVGGPTDGHGQHQVSGEIAQEVFTAAADPKMFPELGLPAWAPVKVYGRMPFSPVDERGMFDYATGKWVPTRFYNYVSNQWSTKAPQPTVMVPEGEASSLLGKSYVQFARQGLALQKTQIGSWMRVPPAGRFDVGYMRYGSRVEAKPEEADFFEGVDVTLAGIATLAPSLKEQRWLREGLQMIAQAVADAQRNYDPSDFEKTAVAFRTGLTRTRELITRVEGQKLLPARERYDLLHELRIKEVQFSQALVDALGLSLRAEVDGATSVVAGRSIQVKVRLTSVVKSPLQVRGCNLQALPGDAHERTIEVLPAGETEEVRADHAFERSIPFAFADDAQSTRPPYARANLEQPFYEVRDAALRGAPVAPAPLRVNITVVYEGTTLTLSRIVGAETGRKEEAVSQPVYQPVSIVSPVSVALSPSAGVVPLSERQFTVTAAVQRGGSSRDAAEPVRLELPKGWSAQPVTAGTALKGDAPLATPFNVLPDTVTQRAYTLTAVVREGAKEYREGYEMTGYPGVVRDALYTPAKARVQGVNIKVPAGLKVAYLPGTGDAVERCFAEIGVIATRVTMADVMAGRLAGYDALVMGVRAYAAHRDLPQATAKLLEFAQAGHVVVVQYNTPEYAGADAPYPLSLGAAEKVVEEAAPVRLLLPEAQALRWPNRITPEDFHGWIEERGHGFMEQWDSRYQALTEVQDAGQDPQRGGLLVAPVGKGAYVYCAYALYRQVPEGVPGAFRLLANLVSLGRRP